jgi:hypothetical protein
MTTFRLTIAQFEQMLPVVLADETPDELTNLVLMACTRPRNGIISVPVPPEDARAIAALVSAAAAADAELIDLAVLFLEQLGS